MRRTVKSFLLKMKRLQGALYFSHQIMHIIKKHIILPQVWAAETMILGMAAGVSGDVLNREVAAYLEKSEVERWCLEVHHLIGLRHDHVTNHASGLLLKRLSCLGPGQRVVKHGWDKPSNAAEMIPRTARRTSAIRRRRRDKDHRDLVVQVSEGPDGHSRRSSGASGLIGRHRMEHQSTEFASNSLALLDNYRLLPDEHNEVADQLLRGNIESWWQAYKAYKVASGPSTRAWVSWRAKCLDVGSAHRELWPSAPQVLAYPRNLLKVHHGALRHMLEVQLTDRRLLQRLRAVT